MFHDESEARELHAADDESDKDAAADQDNQDRNAPKLACKVGCYLIDLREIELLHRMPSF